MKENEKSTANTNRSGRQFEIEEPVKSKPKVRVGKNFKPDKTEQQTLPPQSIVMGERLPNQMDYSYLKLEALPIRGLKTFALGTAVLLLSLVIWAIYDTIVEAMSLHWLAGFCILLLSITVALLALVTFYKYRKDQRKQNAYRSIRKLAKRCHFASSNTADQNLIAELKSFYANKPHQVLLDQCLSSLPDYKLGHEVITHIDDVFLKPLDAEALKRVTGFSYKAGLTVALSPWVAVDMALSLWSNIKMIDEIGQIYGVRPSLINRVSMLKSIIGHLALVGASELASDQIVDQLGGTSLASLFSVRLSQGLGVGLYSAKIGLSTIAVSRPIEFVDNEPDLKSLTNLLIEKFKNQLKPTKSSE